MSEWTVKIRHTGRGGGFVTLEHKGEMIVWCTFRGDDQFRETEKEAHQIAASMNALAKVKEFLQGILDNDDQDIPPLFDAEASVLLDELERINP